GFTSTPKMNAAHLPSAMVREAYLLKCYGSLTREDVMAQPLDEAQAQVIDLTLLQELIDRSVATATPSVADSVAYPERQMKAAEFVEFWQSVRLVAMATTGAGGLPHIAPVHAMLEGIKLRLVIYENTVRRADIARNPHVAFTTWRADGAAAIVYGHAREIPNSLRAARPGRSGKPRNVVAIEVSITRIYAMRPPSA
ncbi:MAG TPA: pyridoxamine 5'-phosphate oxidase family protein, partial [Candidatus Binataceae bacterium]|nr:pyridoxamine 5'-phosphate oxidase family protein [Candidatus Binataceae bacterium]